MKLSLNFFGKFDFIGVLLLRIGCGGLIAYIGWPFFVGGPEAWKQIGMAVNVVHLNDYYLIFGLMSAMVQFFGGVAIVLGIFTRFFAFFIAVVLGFAIAQMLQRADELLHVVVATQLFLSFLGLVFIGPGRLSLDRKGI